MEMGLLWISSGVQCTKVGFPIDVIQLAPYWMLQRFALIR